MTKNEVKTVQEGTFSYNYLPAELTINNYEEIKETIAGVADQYKNRVYKDDDLATLNEDHKMLNSLRKGLEDGRKNVKREINEPYKEFEKEIHSLVALIDEPLNDIKAGRDEILLAQEELRKEALYDYLERQLKDSKVQVGDLDIPSKWTNKGEWTEKLNPRKSLKEMIDSEIGRVEEELKNAIAQREVLTKFLEAKDMEVDGWLEQLEYREATEIMDSIQKAEEKRKQLEKQRGEYEEERERIEQAEREVDERTQEEVAQVEPDIFDETGQVITERIEVTGTQEQLNKLNDFMVANGIEVAPIVDEFDFNLEDTLDDLPW